MPPKAALQKISRARPPLERPSVPANHSTQHIIVLHRKILIEEIFDLEELFRVFRDRVCVEALADGAVIEVIIERDE